MRLRTFERRFKNATGDAPTIYIQRIKMKAAKRQLESKNLSFDEISQNLGYLNGGSFRKIFVRWVGLLPSAYRRRFLLYH
jgi:AraC-like DNA-binding protein